MRGGKGKGSSAPPPSSSSSSSSSSSNPPSRHKGPDKSAFYAAILLITIPMVLFFVFVCPYLIPRLGAMVVAVPVYAVVVCLATLFIASSIDPGVLPRGNLENTPPAGEEPKITLTIKGKALTVRWCATCHIIRPPRASHCSDCDRCVEKFDHHCPWVGNCIGKRNYRFFNIFLASATFLCAYVCSFSILRLVWLTKNVPSVVDAVLESPISLVLAIYGFFIFWSVGGLFAYHSYLTAIALTTHEEMKSTFSGGNPYSVNVLYNFVAVWCPPCYPSYQSTTKSEESTSLIEEDEDYRGLNPHLHNHGDESEMDAENEHEPLTFTRRDNNV